MPHGFGMSGPIATINRSVFTINFACGTCGKHWSLNRTLTDEQARATQLVLGDPMRGFRVELCVSCWEMGNFDQPVKFWFEEHAVH